MSYELTLKHIWRPRIHHFHHWLSWFKVFLFDSCNVHFTHSPHVEPQIYYCRSSNVHTALISKQYSVVSLFLLRGWCNVMSHDLSLSSTGRLSWCAWICLGLLYLPPYPYQLPWLQPFSCILQYRFSLSHLLHLFLAHLWPDLVF